MTMVFYSERGSGGGVRHTRHGEYVTLVCDT